jgi:hypothetical protein
MQNIADEDCKKHRQSFLAAKKAAKQPAHISSLQRRSRNSPICIIPQGLDDALHLQIKALSFGKANATWRGRSSFSRVYHFSPPHKLTQRRHVEIDQIKCIGKESNSLENVEEGMIHSEQSVYTEYADPNRSEWITKIQPALKKLPLQVLVKACGERLSRRELIELRAARSRPRRKNRELLEIILKKFGLL